MTLSTHDRALSVESPYAWLVEILVAEDPDPIALRITNSKSSVFFGTSSSGAPLEYIPAPITVGAFEASASGNLPQFSFDVGTTRPDIIALLEEHDWLEGRKCNVRIVNTGNLADLTAQKKWVLEVVSVELAGSGIKVSLGTYNVSRAQNPPQKYSKEVCRHEYGGDACGYDLTNATLLAAHPTCSRSVGGPSGCIAHGEAEATASLPVLHPLRCGVRRGIPRERRLNA